jgi:hypothetical protein
MFVLVRNSIHLLFPYILITIASLGIIKLQSPNVNISDQSLSLEEYKNDNAKEKNELLVVEQMPKLGFTNIVADWLYLGFIQYFGDVEAREKTGYELIPKYFTQIVEDDPHFTDAIYKLDVANTLFAGLPQTSTDLVGKSLASIRPKFIVNIPPYYLWRSKGNNQLLFFNDIDGAKKSYKKSIEWAKAYDSEDSRRIINISEESIHFLENNPTSKFAQISAWVSILANRPDEKTINRIIKQIEALGGKVNRKSDGTISVSLPKEE